MKLTKQQLTNLWVEVEFERVNEFMKNEDSPRHRALLKLRGHLFKIAARRNLQAKVGY